MFELKRIEKKHQVPEEPVSKKSGSLGWGNNDDINTVREDTV